MTSQHPLSRPEPAPDRLTDVLDEGIDPRFVFDFRSYDEPDDDDHQRWSTWLSVEPLSRGPEPRPDWVVTSQAALDTELGILKTGKEADVFLLERAVPDGPSVVMAATIHNQNSELVLTGEHKYLLRKYPRPAQHTKNRRKSCPSFPESARFLKS